AFPNPILFGWLAILGEFLGGLLMAAGLATRVAAIWIVGVMLGAGLVAHADDPWGRKEFALTYAVIALFFFFYGGGKLSADRLFGNASESGKK
ncbi:MAG: DoxX family protein, partial [Myxococcales bacterium]|nr:DoxX family protein [Myxococcales bacterium]